VITAGQAFWLITWGVLWWHLARWLIRLAAVLILAAGVNRRAQHGE